MEDHDRDKDDSKTSKDVTLTTGKTNIRKKKAESGSGAKKSTQTKKSAPKNWWRAASKFRRLEIILLGIGAAGAVLYLFAYIVVSVKQNAQVQMQHMPLVINSRPPEFLQPFICDTKNGFRAGNMQRFAKNIGNASAYHVIPFMNMMKVIPEKRTGDALIDALPLVSCDMKINTGNTGEIEFPLAPGIEIRPQIRQSFASIPPLHTDDPVQLYVASCIYYADEYGGRHGTCDTYRVNFPSTNPLDVLQGSPTFFCDATPHIGKFLGHTTGHCQQ